MLSQILKKSTCADCRFCCSFRRCSLWETPLFEEETAKNLEKQGFRFSYRDGCAHMHLEDSYPSEDAQAEAPCYFLDRQKGCTLSDAEKPFDCKIWPLRLMQKGDKTVVALTPTCPAVNQIPLEELKAFVANGLAQAIFDYGQAHPFIVKPYRDGFPILWEN